MLTSTKESSEASRLFSFDAAAEAEILRGLRELRPLLQAEAAAAEALSSPTDKAVEALEQLGAWAIVVPKRLGGRGISATGLLRISAEMAKGDPSVSWVSQIVNGTTWVTTLASDRIQEEIFGNGVPRICGAFNPPGTAIAVEGGYRVSGRWPYATGFRQALWGQWGVKIVHADGRVAPGNFCYIPTAEMVLDKTWKVPGLQATGSDTAVAEDIFVPAHRMVLAERSYNYVEPGKRHYGDPSDYFSQISLVHRTHAGIMLGAAEALFEVVADIAKSRPAVGTTFARQVDSAVTVRDLGEISIKLSTARLLLESATGDMDRAALDRRAMSALERYRSKAQGAYAAQIMSEAVQALMNIGGSSAFNFSHPASRYWRDFSVGTRHFLYSPNVAYEAHARALLELEPNMVPVFMA